MKASLAVGENNTNAWQCGICNGTWSDEDSVRRHVVAVHPETLEPADEIVLTASDRPNPPTQQSEQTVKAQSQTEIPGVEKFTDSFTGEEQKPSDSQEKILEKRIGELKQLNEKQLLAEIKALKERAYRLVLSRF